MQYVRGNVGPELAENVGQSVASQSIRIFFGKLFAGIALAWIVGRGNSLSDAATQHFGNIESIVAVVFSCNEDASRSVCAALPDPTFSQGIIALILVKGGRQEANHPIVTIRLVHEAAPVVCPIGARVRAQLGVSVGTKGQSRSDAYEDEGRVVKAVLRSEYEGLPERWRGRNGTGTHGAKIRHDTENPLRLQLSRINVAFVDRLAWSIRQIRRSRSRR